MSNYTKAAVIMMSLVVAVDGWLVWSVKAESDKRGVPGLKTAWEQGYMAGVKQTLDATRVQVQLRDSTGKMDQALMGRTMHSGLTNNPYKN
jgi:hypothetical protein